MFRAILRWLRGRPATSCAPTFAPTHVRRLERADDRLSGELTRVERLSDGDCILCVAGDVIPCAGTIVSGRAQVRVSAFASATANSVPWVLGHGASVHPGMSIVSDFLIVRVGDDARDERATGAVRSRLGRRRLRERAERRNSA